LGDLHLAALNQPSRGHAGWLHQFTPGFATNLTGRF
jgi:hypothetical protein